MVPRQVHLQPEWLRAGSRRAPAALLGFAVAWACSVTGLALLCGILRFSAPRSASITAGIILILIGINRFLLVRWKSKPRHRRSVDVER